MNMPILPALLQFVILHSARHKQLLRFYSGQDTYHHGWESSCTPSTGKPDGLEMVVPRSSLLHHGLSLLQSPPDTSIHKTKELQIRQAQNISR